MQPISFEEVLRIRDQIARAHVVAGERFQYAFSVQGDIPPNERWRSHLEIQAAALLESATRIRLDQSVVHYDILGQIVVPYVVRGEPLFPHFRIERSAPALLEYWMLVSELLGTASWRMTNVIASNREYDDALRRMSQPQIVRALAGSFLPAAEWRDDGTAMLEVTLYTRAVEERIERRHLALDALSEFHYHSRELIAEGTGGVRV